MKSLIDDSSSGDNQKDLLLVSLISNWLLVLIESIFRSCG